MFTSFKQYFVGPTSEQLKSTIKKDNEESIAKVNFGLLFGDVYFIKPSENMDLTDFMNQLDTQPDGRKPMSVIDYVLSGPSLLASTDENALAHHRLFFLSLSRPDDYISLTLNALDEYLDSRNEFSLKDIATVPIREILTKGLFHLDEQSPEFNQALETLSNANKESSQDVADEVRQYLVGINYPRTFSYALSMLAKQGKEQYLTNVKKFINNQGNKILADLHNYANNLRVTNLFSLSVIYLIKEEYAFKDDRHALNTLLQKMNRDELQVYLNHPYIRTLPGMMVAADGIVAILACALSALATNKKLLHKIRNEIENKSLLCEDDALSIRGKIEMNRSSGGLLHRIYLESLRMISLQKSVEEKQFSGISWRYTDRNISINGQTIPANSMIAVLRNWYLFDEIFGDMPDQFKPSRFKDKESGELKNNIAKLPFGLFSQGKRMCPSYKISEYIFKVFIAYVVTNYDLALTQSPNEKRLDQINITLSAITKGENLFEVGPC